MNRDEEIKELRLTHSCIATTFARTILYNYKNNPEFRKQADNCEMLELMLIPYFANFAEWYYDTINEGCEE